MISTTHAMPASIASRQGLGGASRLPGPAVASVTLRWDVSPRALTAAGAGARLLNGHAATLRSCSLVVRVQGLDGRGGCVAHARLDLRMAGGQTDSIPLTELPGVSATLDIDAATDCLNVEAPGVLSLTLRTREALALRFARTPLLTDRLGLPGGVYDAPGLEPG